MKAVVIFESRTGNTQRAAEMIGGELRRAGYDVSVRPVHGLKLTEVAEADLLAVGTWVDGLVLFGHRPGGTAKLMTLPSPAPQTGGRPSPLTSGIPATA